MLRQGFILLFLFWYLCLSFHSIHILFNQYTNVMEVEEENPDDSFLCEGHGCGCDTLEQCQKSCCCFPDRNIKKNKTEYSFENALKCQGRKPVDDHGITGLFQLDLHIHSESQHLRIFLAKEKRSRDKNSLYKNIDWFKVLKVPILG